MNEPTDPLITFADGTTCFKRDCDPLELETRDWHLATDAEVADYLAEYEAYHAPEHLAYLDDLCKHVGA